MDLAQKVGTARGIGFSIAGRLCEARASVVLTDLKTGNVDGAVSRFDAIVFRLIFWL